MIFIYMIAVTGI